MVVFVVVQIRSIGLWKKFESDKIQSNHQNMKKTLNIYNLVQSIEFKIQQPFPFQVIERFWILFLVAVAVVVDDEKKLTKFYQEKIMWRISLHFPDTKNPNQSIDNEFELEWTIICLL